jgi:hypothetical protein
VAPPQPTSGSHSGISPDHERLTEGERRWYADYIKRHFGIDIGSLHNW